MDGFDQRWPPRTTRNIALVLNDRSYYNMTTLVQNCVKAAPQFIRNLDVEAELEDSDLSYANVHCLEWSPDGSRLASSSIDPKIRFFKPFINKLEGEIETPHAGDIEDFKFLSQTSMATMGALDGCCHVIDIKAPTQPIWSFNLQVAVFGKYWW